MLASPRAALYLLLSSATCLASTIQFTPNATLGAGNPWIGFVPYNFNGGSLLFPHSLENLYFPWNSIQTGPGAFNFSSIEEVLAVCASRGHQLIARVYADYPGNPYAVPEFLRPGLATCTYTEVRECGSVRLSGCLAFFVLLLSLSVYSCLFVHSLCVYPCACLILPVLPVLACVWIRMVAASSRITPTRRLFSQWWTPSQHWGRGSIVTRDSLSFRCVPRRVSSRGMVQLWVWSFIFGT